MATAKWQQQNDNSKMATSKIAATEVVKTEEEKVKSKTKTKTKAAAAAAVAAKGKVKYQKLTSASSSTKQPTKQQAKRTTNQTTKQGHTLRPTRITEPKSYPRGNCNEAFSLVFIFNKPITCRNF